MRLWLKNLKNNLELLFHARTINIQQRKKRKKKRLFLCWVIQQFEGLF